MAVSPKPFCPSFSKSLHIHFNYSPNDSGILLLNGLVMVTNSKGQLLANVSNKETYGMLTLISHISFITERSFK